MVNTIIPLLTPYGFMHLVPMLIVSHFGMNKETPAVIKIIVSMNHIPVYVMNYIKKIFDANKVL